MGVPWCVGHLNDVWLFPATDVAATTGRHVFRGDPGQYLTLRPVAGHQQYRPAGVPDALQQRTVERPRGACDGTGGHHMKPQVPRRGQVGDQRGEGFGTAGRDDVVIVDEEHDLRGTQFLLRAAGGTGLQLAGDGTREPRRLPEGTGVGREVGVGF